MVPDLGSLSHAKQTGRPSGVDILYKERLVGSSGDIPSEELHKDRLTLEIVLGLAICLLGRDQTVLVNLKLQTETHLGKHTLDMDHNRACDSSISSGADVSGHAHSHHLVRAIGIHRVAHHKFILAEIVVCDLAEIAECQRLLGKAGGVDDGHYVLGQLVALGRFDDEGGGEGLLNVGFVGLTCE